MSQRAPDDAPPEASGSLPTQVDAPQARRSREPTQPGPLGQPSLSAFDPPNLRFEARGEIGRGGMGRVDEAFDRALGRQVAIKHILSDSPVDLARFEREARITARLEHPGIVPVHDAGRSPDGTPYYVMRQVDGRPLDELVAGRPLAERLALVPDVLAVCDAAGYAHARGVVHRDIKPSNILVGPFGETLLIDWGLARDIGEVGADGGAPLGPESDPQLTRAGAIAGTPGFMAPEQARGETVDARADVFALGATLFHVLAGRPPYAAPSATEMIHAVSTDRPPDWTRIPRGVPADLLAIVHKAMSIEPAGRYPDAGAMAGDLRRFVTGKLVAAHAYGIVEQLVRFGRRHRAALAVGAIAALLLGALGVISIRRIVDERDAADAARVAAEARRREAADLRDGVIVDRAKDLARTDPLATIALLRDLPPESSRWPEASAAASAAFFRGIPSGFELSTDSIGSAEIGPDNRHAVVSTIQGDVVIIDLVARTRRTLAHGRAGAWCQFVLHGTHVLCRLHEAALDLIDVDTGALQTLRLGATPVEVIVDHEARAWVSVDHYLVELDLAHPEAPPSAPLAVEVITATWVPDANRLVVFTKHGIDVRGATQTWHLPEVANDVGQPILGTSIVIGVGSELEVWDLAGDPTMTMTVNAGSNVLVPVAYVNHRIWVTDGRSVRILGPKGPGGTAWSDMQMWGVRPGVLLAAHDDGSITVDDALGHFQLGARPLTYNRMTMSSDHRFVLAGTPTGVVVWWDLSALRATTLSVDQLEHPLWLRRWLWMGEANDVIRRDLATGERAEADANLGFGGEIFIDPSEHYLAVGHGAKLSVLDFDDKRVVFESADPAVMWTFGSLGVVMNRGVSVTVAAPPDFHPREIGSLPEEGQMIVQHGRYVFVTTSHHACRFTVGEPLECSLVPGTVAPTYIGVDADGRAWLLEDGIVHRWDRGGAWTTCEVGQRLDGFVQMEGRTVAYGSTSLVLLDDQLHSIVVPALRGLVAAQGIAAYEGPGQTINVADLDAGTTFELPVGAHIPGELVTDGHRIGYMTGADDRAFRTLELSVPREREALQAWLVGITNARQTHNGVVSFP